MTTARRTFIQIAPVTAIALLAPRVSFAVDLDPKDPQATALGYVIDATKADKAKFPKYKAGEDCATCQLFQGKAGAATGPCTLFGGKSVHAKGWCGAFVKKA